MALLYVQERPNLRYTRIDGSPVNFLHDGKVLEFLPGKHSFEVEISNYTVFGGADRTTHTTNFLISSFALELDMRAGFTYSLNFHGIKIIELPRTF